MSQTVPIGQIMGAFGIKGWVKVKVLTDFAERFDVGRRVRIDGEWQVIENAQIHNNQLVLKLSGIPDRNRAEELYLAKIEAMDGERPELEKDEYLTRDLIGMAVVTKEGEALGHVDEVMAMPAHDILVVGEIMIPAVKAFVKKVDLKARRITVVLIEGMRE
jgi:16S rRNA processing protein RimM